MSEKEKTQIDISAVVKAIEADAGQPIDDLSQSLKEMQKAREGSHTRTG